MPVEIKAMLEIEILLFHSSLGATATRPTVIVAGENNPKSLMAGVQ
jgi:hypothetical protein